MSESRKRRVYGAQFKAKVGLDAIHGMKTLNELGQQYGVHPMVISKWKREIQEHAATLFEGSRGPKPVEHADEDQLYNQIGRLKVELDWLKKKSGL